MDAGIAIPWPGWRVEKLIGRGGFGSVYEISRDIFGSPERSALKVMSIPANDTEIANLMAEGYDQAALARHFRVCLEEIAGEYAMMVKMKGHPNVVYCDDFHTEPHADGIGWDIYIRMELLRPLLKVLPPQYNEAMTVRLGRDICRALLNCERQNVLHRDIKPENVFLTETGSFKLGDFGVAKVIDKIAFGTRIGTYDYMAPEVYQNKPYGFSCDRYSLAMMLYWTMNEYRVPFLERTDRVPTAAEKEEARRRRVSGEPVPEPLYGSPALRRVVMRALSFQPEDRFLSAETMLNALEAIPLTPMEANAAFRETPAPSPRISPELTGMFRKPSLEDL